MDSVAQDRRDQGASVPSEVRESLPGLAISICRRLRSREVVTFLAVGGCGYLVDVVAFNLLLSHGPLTGYHPAWARGAAMLLAMVVTYLGNRLLTWRSASEGSKFIELLLFGLLNMIGLSISVVALLISHDLLGMTSRLADNISANVVGVGLGMIFRFWSYRRFVFAPPAPDLLSTGPLDELVDGASEPLRLAGTAR